MIKRFAVSRHARLLRRNIYVAFKHPPRTQCTQRENEFIRFVAIGRVLCHAAILRLWACYRKLPMGEPNPALRAGFEPADALRRRF